MKKMSVALYVINILILILFLFVKSINSEMFNRINEYYNSNNENFNRKLTSIFLRKSDTLVVSEIYELDSLFKNYLNGSELDLNDVIQIKNKIYAYAEIDELNRMYSDFDYQYKIMNNKYNLPKLLKIYLYQIRENVLNYKFHQLKQNEMILNCSTSFLRFQKPKCDEMFIGKFYITDVYKIQSKIFTKTIELENNFKIPKSDFEKFKDSLKISVLNDAGNKFIPTEVHYIN